MADRYEMVSAPRSLRDRKLDPTRALGVGLDTPEHLDGPEERMDLAIRAKAVEPNHDPAASRHRAGGEAVWEVRLPENETEATRSRAQSIPHPALRSD